MKVELMIKSDKSDTKYVQLKKGSLVVPTKQLRLFLQLFQITVRETSNQHYYFLGQDK